VLKTAVLSRVLMEGGKTSDKTDVFSTSTKKNGKTFFFIGHEVFFYESAFAIEQCANPLHPAT
jgi:hypothetical protein